MKQIKMCIGICKSDVLYQDLSNVKQVSTTLLTFSKQVTETKTLQHKIKEPKLIPLYMHFYALG
jgi:hypothetical protein